MSHFKNMHKGKGNTLFPVFLKLEQLHLLVVGGGYVGLEKISAIYANCPEAKVTLVAPEIREEIRALAEKNENLYLIYRSYQKEDLIGKDLAIAATAFKDLNRQVRKDAKQQRILVNVADTPDLCDFYLSSVVKKGELKIAVSTNGKSPTFAKRIREMLEDTLPDEIDAVLDNLQKIRNQLKGDFDSKVKKLNEITSVMKGEEPKE